MPRHARDARTGHPFAPQYARASAGTTTRWLEAPIAFDPRGGLYAAVTLPNLIVGTVGGGTSLPSQRACLEILGLAGSGKAQALAEVCAALALAGELSIVGALCAGEFARAHERLRRWRSEVWHAGRDDGR